MATRLPTTAPGVTVLFGGSDSHLDYETWEWDGNVWTLRGSGGPKPRDAMVYKSARGVTVLFAGCGGFNGDVLGETSEWDGDKRAWWSNYASGWPGTNGIPSFAASGDPVLCSTIHSRSRQLARHQHHRCALHRSCANRRAHHLRRRPLAREVDERPGVLAARSGPGTSRPAAM